MASAIFRFHGILGEFLAREHRGQAFAHACARAATLKNAIEALGVPHTEAGRVEVNGRPASLGQALREGDRVEVHPWVFEALPGRPRFVADAHLGALARFLRMLGYDTRHDNAYADAEILRIVGEEGRIALSRDRELLKCRGIQRGCYVHERKPEAQLREVAGRYDLIEGARPFTLCLACNLPLEPATTDEARAYAPPAVLERQAGFQRCGACRRIYWPGTHYERMRQALARILPG